MLKLYLKIMVVQPSKDRYQLSSRAKWREFPMLDLLLRLDYEYTPHIDVMNVNAVRLKLKGDGNSYRFELSGVLQDHIHKFIVI